VVFTARERTLVLEHTFAGSEVTDPLEAARQRAGKYTVRYTLDDLDELLGYVAAEANHAKAKSLQKELDSLFERLREVMESYDDGQWQKPLGSWAAGAPKATGRATLSVVKRKDEP